MTLASGYDSLVVLLVKMGPASLKNCKRSSFIAPRAVIDTYGVLSVVLYGALIPKVNLSEQFLRKADVLFLRETAWSLSTAESSKGITIPDKQPKILETALE